MGIFLSILFYLLGGIYVSTLSFYVYAATCYTDDRKNFWVTIIVGLMPILPNVLMFTIPDINNLLKLTLSRISYLSRKFYRFFIRDRHYRIDKETIKFLDPLREEDWRE